MIQGVSVDVTINYNKLHADPKQGKSLDIVLKKVKVNYWLQNFWQVLEADNKKGK